MKKIYDSSKQSIYLIVHELLFIILKIVDKINNLTTGYFKSLQIHNLK